MFKARTGVTKEISSITIAEIKEQNNNIMFVWNNLHINYSRFKDHQRENVTFKIKLFGLLKDFYRKIGELLNKIYIL